MYTRIIKRNKITHCGIRVNNMGEIMTVSLCNKRWYDNDKTSIADTSEVTCKRCQKILAKADDNGMVRLT